MIPVSLYQANKPTSPPSRRRLDEQPGKAVSRLYCLPWRRHCGRRIHERADLGGDGGAPAGYDAAAYGRDFKIFHAFAKQAAPDMQILGPGSVGEVNADWAVASGYDGSVMLLKSHDLLAASGPVQAAHCSGARMRSDAQRALHLRGRPSSKTVLTRPRDESDFAVMSRQAKRLSGCLYPSFCGLICGLEAIG